MYTTTTKVVHRVIPNAVQRHKLRHVQFLNLSTREGKYKRRKIAKDVTITDHGSFKEVEHIETHVLDKGRTIHADGLPFLHNLEGCPKQLMLYLLYHELNEETGVYKFDQQVVVRFKEYCLAINGKAPTDSTIRKANRTLVDMNIAQNKSRGRYMMNPLLSGGSSQGKRELLIREYIALLKANQKDISYDFYPRYPAAA